VVVALLLLLRRRLQEPESVEGAGPEGEAAGADTRDPEVLVVEVRVVVRGEEVGAPAQRGRDGVRVLALVRGDHHRRVLERPLHPLLHGALLRRAPVVAPAFCIIKHHMICSS